MTGIHSITFFTNPMRFRNSRNTTIPPKGVKARSVSVNTIFRPSKIRVPSASIRSGYAAHRPLNFGIQVKFRSD